LWSFGGMEAPDSNKVKGYLDTQGSAGDRVLQRS
jgi:hypothetical protein